EPIIEPTPANDDPEAEAAVKAAQGALAVIKKAVKYDYLRVIEAINLRLFGNSFRYNYFSKDSRYGYLTPRVHGEVDFLFSHGALVCQKWGPMEGNFQLCPSCGLPIQQQPPPIVAKLPQVTGTVRFPRGEIMTEAVNPLEIYLRSSSYDLWH